MASWFLFAWIRSWFGLVFTTSADGPAASLAAAFSMSLELVHAPSASDATAARAAASGARRLRALTVVLSSVGDARARATDGRRAGAPSERGMGPSEDAGQEGAGPLVLRCVEHLFRGAALDDAAAVHEDHLVGGLAGEADLVGDHDHRRAVA